MDSLPPSYALSIIMVFHTALLFIKELISQQMKYGNEPVLMEFTSLTVLHHTKQLSINTLCMCIWGEGAVLPDGSVGQESA